MNNDRIVGRIVVVEMCFLVNGLDCIIMCINCCI